MKTPEGIKKGLYCCHVDPYGRKCDECPYDFISEKYCDSNLGADALDYIMLENKCAEYGVMINYYEDAINAFGG